MHCSHFIMLIVASSCISPKALAGLTLVSMLESEDVSYTDPDRSREVPNETTWNGIAGTSSSDSSMSETVLALPARTIDDVVAWGGREPDDWLRGD